MEGSVINTEMVTYSQSFFFFSFSDVVVLLMKIYDGPECAVRTRGMVTTPVPVLVKFNDPFKYLAVISSYELQFRCFFGSLDSYQRGL
jgi:hypothetical protein